MRGIGYFFIGLLFLVLGVFAFLVRREWLVFRIIPPYSVESSAVTGSSNELRNKKIAIYYWKDGKRQEEVVDSAWGASTADNVFDLVGLWLAFLYQEKLINRRVNLEDVALSSSGYDLFISFDHTIFERDWSIRRKWQLLDGLYKTISRAGVNIQAITFLVKHEKLNDDHLDFSRPWAVSLFE